MSTRRIYRDELAAPSPAMGADSMAAKEADGSLVAALVAVVQSAGALVKAQLATSGRTMFVVSAVGALAALLGLVGLGFLIFAIYDAFVYAWLAFGVDEFAVTAWAKLATSVVVVLAAAALVMLLRSILERPKVSRQG